MHSEGQIEKAAKAIERADALLIAAGAGMGVDSGLPDFRGNEGFWKAYPPFRDRGLSFVDLANPGWFYRGPQQAWGFYGHRLNLYRATTPHAGFDLLRRWGESKPLGCFVFTSNVDGQFQKAGFADDQLVECHGSIHHLQCMQHCTGEIWPADEATIVVDEATFRAAPPLPACPRCGELARPNILMFGDPEWHVDRTGAQVERYRHWLGEVAGKELTIVECGAGTTVPTVRAECERQRGTLIRINPRAADVPPGGISIAESSLAALQRIERLMAGA